MRPVRAWAPLLVLVLAVTGGGAPVEPTPSAAAPAPRVVLHANQSDIRPGEAVLFRGRVLAGSRPLAGVRVVLQSRAPGRRFRVLERRRTGGTGWFVFARVPGGTRDFRVRFVGRHRPDAVSLLRTVTRRRSGRSLDQRADLVRSYVGPRQSGPTTTTRDGTSVQHATHARGTLATVGQDTWVVRGPIGDRYAALRGVAGRLGAPLDDQKCQQIGAVCVQRFQRGAIVHDRRAPTTVTHAFGRPDQAAFEAVARSQVGYRGVSKDRSKYTGWIGRHVPWCGIFLAWVSRASGNGDAYPKLALLDAQVREVRSRGRQLERPRAGAAVFFDNRRLGRPTHVALVTKVRKDGRIETIDGNAGPKSDRRVRALVKRTHNVMYYWVPRTG